MRRRWARLTGATFLAMCALIAAPAAAQPPVATTQAPQVTPAPQPRPRVGVAFGGGGARGLAHVGVLRWLEDHRIPIDMVAGTSMGGLVGGAFAAGLSARELTTVLETADWDEMFGAWTYRYKNIRRKEDARAYPSRIELGLRNGLTMPLALNSGQEVDFFLARIANVYLPLATFDDLPTPFRAIAVDLVTSQQVVLDRGSLASAMRATMSLPGIFPPVENGSQVLVDGGALNNVPADVVRAMGADVVIAIDVGSRGNTRAVSRSLFGLMSQTIDVMIQSRTRASIQMADIVIHPSLDQFTSLDWRRSAALEEEGYRAAESARGRLLPLALDETAWAVYQEHRRARRPRGFGVPQFVAVTGVAPADRKRIEDRLATRVGQPLDVDGLERDLEIVTGLDRYETVGWRLEESNGSTGLHVDARSKPHAPPLLMVGITLQNTTRDDFAFQLAARYLTFITGSGPELRVDGAVGADPAIGAELYVPAGSPLFFTASAEARRHALNFVREDVIVARYQQSRMAAGGEVGVNLDHDSDLRLGLGYGRLDTNVAVGDPGLPEFAGPETRLRVRWRHDTQDSPAVPSSGTRASATIEHILNTPEPPADFSTGRSNDDVTQAELRTSTFWPRRGGHRTFLSAGAGTTWGNPLATEQFELGTPLRLGAYDLGELRGDHYGLVTLGYLHAVGRLPDFLGGPILLGGWVEAGSAFDDVEDATLRTSLSLGAVAETIAGPLLFGVSADVRGAWRYYVAIGRLF